MSRLHSTHSFLQSTQAVSSVNIVHFKSATVGRKACESTYCYADKARSRYRYAINCRPQICLKLFLQRSQEKKHNERTTSSVNSVTSLRIADTLDARFVFSVVGDTKIVSDVMRRMAKVKIISNSAFCQLISVVSLLMITFFYVCMMTGLM